MQENYLNGFENGCQSVNELISSVIASAKYLTDELRIRSFIIPISWVSKEPTKVASSVDCVVLCRTTSLQTEEKHDT